MPESRRTSRRSSGESDALDLADLVAMLERNRFVALGTALVVVAGCLAWSSTRAPVYRTQATLKLEQDGASKGVLGDLAALTSAPAAEGEMAILRSRAMVEATLAEPSTWPEHASAFAPTRPDDFRMDGARELGLTTRVECEDRKPFRDLGRVFGLRAAPAARLFARFGADSPTAPPLVRVHFPEDAGGKRVRLSLPGSAGMTDRDAQEFDYVPRAAINYQGARIELEAVGDYAGTSHLVERRSLDAAVDEYLGKLQVEETSRNSGVIRLTVSDSDPDRAAEFANALCHNYLLRSIRLGRSRATRTIEFVDEQLTEQKRLLAEAEREVVALQQENPAVILVSASAESILRRLSDLESERARCELARVALGEAAELLDRGEADALARLSRELPDLVSLSYIEAIGRLGGEALALERSDAGPTKSLLRAKLDELGLAEHESRARLDAIDSAVAALAAGDAGAVARLFAEAPELVQLDPTTQLYLTESARIDAESAALSSDVTPENPRWIQLQGARTDLGKKLAARLEDLAAGLRLALDDRAALAKRYEESLASWPAAERAQIDGALAELTRRVSKNLHARIESLASQETGLASEVRDLEAELARLPESERAVAEPLRRREAHAQVVRLLLESQQQAQLSAAATLPSAILIDPAIPPESRHSPRLLFDFVLALFAGLGLGLLASFVRQSLSGAVHTQAEVEEATGLSVFGSIPDFRRGALRALKPRGTFLPLRDDPDGPLSEAYRSVRESLRFAQNDGAPLRTLACTSCAPGEGKSTTNINLAMSFAGPGQRVLLVDADMRKPTVHSTFDLQLAPGLGEVLEGRAAWRECVRASGHEGLELLCAGAPHASPSELLRGARTSTLLAEWRASYDLVVFDLPPALAVADAEILARELDLVLLVYRAGGVHREALASMTRKLTRAGARVGGAVVNAVRPSRAGASAYYGGYGYGYGAKRGGARRAPAERVR
ncbi:MAG: polysaccharide biosynthesis tyrosine autokinase [Planctomycetes bacterium]|nr:polysaccharide biosynthesis tyrosine autokinase [Planctomycetota bacterium]